jgi:Xaa-Pro dipeptidase
MTAAIVPLTALPSTEELQARLANIRRLMEQESPDVYVAAHTDNVYYLTNFAYIPFERPFFLAVPLDGRPTLIVPGLEMSHAKVRVLLEVEYKAYYEYLAPAGRTYVNALF